MLTHSQQTHLDTSSHGKVQHDRHGWPRWPYIVLLCVLFFGPLVAPLFQATGLPLISDSGALARDVLSRYVCPTPAKSYALLGFPMAVCARCWGATIGLWIAYLLVRRPTNDQRPTTIDQPSSWFSVLGSRSVAFPWPARLFVAALPFLLWVAEIRWWQSAPLWALLLNGALAGCAAGLFFCSLWPGMTRARS